MPVAAGVIAMWSGTLAAIPANWVLCDGTSPTPNLVGRFIVGAAAATEAGGTGGSDNHTHASMTAAGSHTHSLGARTHVHTTNLSASHLHYVATTCSTDTYGTYSLAMRSQGAHSHTTTTGTSSHSHTSADSGTHTHTISTDDGRPPYYELAYVRSNGSAEVSAGIIIIWTGTLATIPTGWALCNGTSSPDMRNRFVRGINTSATNPGTTGGAATHIHTETAAVHKHGDSDSQGDHYHSFSAYTWTHTHNYSTYKANASGVNPAYEQADTGAGNHTHGKSSTTGAHVHSLGSGGSHGHTVNATSSLPSYYDVAFIIATSATALPVGGIVIWTGTLASIPSEYLLCDSTNSTPGLQGLFIRGSAAGVNPGGTGGSNTHTHTDQNNATHSYHACSSAGSHKHSNTNLAGLHNHSYNIRYATPSYGTYEMTNNNGSHGHSYNTEDAHTHAIGDASAVHNHSPWSTDSGLPAYYVVQFIMFSAQPNISKIDTITADTGIGKVDTTSYAVVDKIDGVATYV